jgi:hypothetical protein
LNLGFGLNKRAYFLGGIKTVMSAKIVTCMHAVLICGRHNVGFAEDLQEECCREGAYQNMVGSPGFEPEWVQVH